MEVCGTKLLQPDAPPLVLIGVYMPNDNNLTSYLSTLDNLCAIYDNYSVIGNVIFISDFNARIGSDPISYAAQQKRKYFQEFVAEYNLLPVNKRHICDGFPYTLDNVRV